MAFVYLFEDLNALNLIIFYFFLEMEMVEAVALFDYHGRTHRELSFQKNQLIFISKQMNSEWWFGYLPSTNQSGYIPNGYIKFNRIDPPIPASRVLSSIDGPPSTSSSMIDIDTTLREALSDIPTHTPDLVLNLPKLNLLKSFDEHIPIVHSTIIIDLKPSKSEKTIQLLKPLHLTQSKATEV